MKKTVIFVPISTRTLANLLGNKACKELNDLIELYEMIDEMDDAKETNKLYEEFISWSEINKSSDEFITDTEDCSPVYWSYSQWFKEVFIEDYDKALIEVEQQTIPFDRELCILRLAREAANKYIDTPYLFKFCREYLIDSAENTIFWTEYYFTKQNQ